MEDHVNGVIYRPVGKRHGVQERVCDGFEVGQKEALKGLHYQMSEGQVYSH